MVGAPQPQLPRLLPKGQDMVDSKGRAVELRGCNLGNWLMLEMWMLTWADKQGFSDQYTMEELLVKRFGEAKKNALMEVYRENFITERDIKLIKSFRFNLLRLPLNYRLFEDDTNPKKLKPNAWKWIDRALQLAEKEGMYVILDLHGAQGGQSTYDHTGRSGQNKLWTVPENLDRMAWLWTEIAKRYKGRSSVLAYDVFNEPYGGTHEGQIKVMKKCYEAIRSQDKDTLIFAHGHYDTFTHYGTPESNGWKNVGYQLHFYPGLFGNGNPSILTHQKHLQSLEGWGRITKEWNVPFLVGEMNVVFKRAGGAEMMRRTFDVHAQNKWMTTMWSYKAFGEGGFGDDHWGMVTNADPLPPLDLQADSYEKIETWFKGLSTMKLAVNEPLRKVMAPKTVKLSPIPELPKPRTTAPQESLPGWQSADLGGALKGGLEVQGGQVSLFGGGGDMWGARDEGRLLYKTVGADFTLTVKVESMEDLEQYSKAGLMVRASDDPGAACVLLSSFAGGEVQFAHRKVQAGTMEATEAADLALPLWMRITRKGETLIGETSADGIAWKEIGRASIPALGGKALVGPIALSHNQHSLIKIGYSNLKLEAKPQ
jgi:endoglucanase